MENLLLKKLYFLCNSLSGRMSFFLIKKFITKLFQVIYHHSWNGYSRFLFRKLKSFSITFNWILYSTQSACSFMIMLIYSQMSLVVIISNNEFYFGVQKLEMFSFFYIQQT